MKNTILVIAFYLIYQLSFAQERKIAVINDPDGYTNIRAGKGTESEIVGKIFDYEVFSYSEQPNEQWLEVTISKCACEDHQTSYSKPINGYVHRSRILDLNLAHNSMMKEKLEKIFNHELELYNNRKNYADRSSDDYKIATNKWVVFHEMMFDEVLRRFTDYICFTRDKELFQLYNQIIVTESGSADELPSFTIGKIFKCVPEWTLERIPKSHDYFYLLEWGCQGVSDKKHQRLLNEHRTNIGLEQVDYDNYEY